MGRQAESDAQSTYGTSSNAASNYQNQANKAYSTVTPFLTKELTNPQGYSSQELAQMLSASAQGAGGGEASAVGSGNLLASKSRNAAGYAAAADDAARGSMAQKSQDTLNILNQSDQLSSSRQQDAAGALQSLYGNGTQATLQALGAANGATNALNTANAQTQSAWMTPLTTAMSGAATYFKH